MSRAPTGGAARERLEEKLNQACSKSTELEQKIQKLQQVAKKLSSQELLNGENVAGFELMSKLGLDNADPFLSEALPTIVTNACEDYPNQDGEPFAGDFWNRPVPAQALLQYTYFFLKDIQEAYKKTREKYTKLQAQFAKLTDKLDSTKAKRKQHAETGLKKVEKSRQPDARELHLARRNQINRVRRGVKKQKKVRPEESLSEARN